jgi:hypothetical protein
MLNWARLQIKLLGKQQDKCSLICAQLEIDKSDDHEFLRAGTKLVMEQLA